MYRPKSKSNCKIKNKNTNKKNSTEHSLTSNEWYKASECGSCWTLAKFTHLGIAAHSLQVGSIWLLLYYRKIILNSYSPTTVALNPFWLMARLHLHLRVQFTQLHATQLNFALRAVQFMYFVTTFLVCKSTDILAIFPAYLYLWCLKMKMTFSLRILYSQLLNYIFQPFEDETFSCYFFELLHFKEHTFLKELVSRLL